MLHRLSWFLCSLLLLIAPHLCHAQKNEVPGPPRATAPAKIDPATEKKALDLLESISDQIPNLRSPANRLRAECTVADLLWSRDEKRARLLFTSALTQLTARISDLDYSDPDIYQELGRVSAARQELVLRIAAHDPELALYALRQTRLPENSRPRGSSSFQNENSLELSVAALVAAKNPEAALKLARSNLSRGVTNQLVSFLSQLYEKDQKSAQTLYQEIVAQIKDDTLERSPDLANVAWNLLASFPPPQADEDTFRDLVTTVLNMVLKANRETQSGLTLAQNFYYQRERMVPLIEQYAPARAAELRDWSQTVERTIDPQAMMYQELNKISQSGSVDDMLALAAKYPPEFQNLLYQNAAWKAFKDHDSTRAREIIDLMSDPVQRKQMRDALDNQTANALEGNSRITEARRLTDQAKNVIRKMDIMIQMANSAAADGDKKSALELLGQAKIIATAASQPSEQMSSLLRLAQAYLRLDPGQSFSILQPLITKLNELVAAAAVLDGIDFQYLRDGEWVMPGMNNLGNLVSLLDQTLAALGQTDFDRATALANQVARPEMRVIMQIDLAQATLGGKAGTDLLIGGRGMSMGRTIIY